MPDPLAPNAVRGLLALVRLTFRRHWRVRGLGWATAGLIGLMAVVVGVVSNTPAGWGLARRPVWVADLDGPGTSRITYTQYADERAVVYATFPGSPEHLGMKLALFAPMRAALHDAQYLADYEFLNFSRWVVFGMYLGFLLPLVGLAFASGALGAEKEDRTLVWLTTRPLPRSGLYLAKFLGVLPWVVLVAAAGFAAVCVAGGPLGRRAFLVYWPAVLAGATAFAALFHFIGATVKRPAVVGLVYIFFFEVVVANLPGSLKRLSLNYYVRSLMYNEATGAAPAVVPDSLDVYEPISAFTAWAVLAGATVALTAVGMAVFARLEPGDDA